MRVRASGLEGSRQRRERLGLEDEAHAAPFGRFVRVAEQPEAGHVGHGVRLERAQRVGGRAVEGRHPAGCLGDVVRLARENEARPERLRKEDRIARPGAALHPDCLRVDGADDSKTVLWLDVTDRVATRKDRAGRAHLLVRAREDRGDDVGLELLRKRGDREREERYAAHREYDR